MKSNIRSYGETNEEKASMAEKTTGLVSTELKLIVLTETKAIL